jgi:hypothetical protein
MAMLPNKLDTTSDPGLASPSAYGIPLLSPPNREIDMGRPLLRYLVPFEIAVVMGYGELVFNSLAAFWLGCTLADALEFVGREV